MSSSRIQSQSSDVPIETFVLDQDVSSLKKATKRSRYKCQDCRRKRIKVSGPTAFAATGNGASVVHSQQCVPELRDWENQKCDPCERNGEVCGPNILAPSKFNLRHKSIGPNAAAQVPGEIGQYSNHVVQPVTPANNGTINSFGLSSSSDYGLPVNWNLDPGHVGPMNTSPAAPAATNLTFQLPQDDEAATQR
jgi:hypothetical protein